MLGSVRCSSACSCIGVTGVTTTALAPSTTITVTATATTTAEATPQITLNEYDDLTCSQGDEFGQDILTAANVLTFLMSSPYSLARSPQAHVLPQIASY